MREKNGLAKIFINNTIWILLIIVIIFFGFFTKNFFTFQNLLNILAYGSIIGIMVVGQSFTLITGNFDLSMESTLGLCGMLGIWLISDSGEPNHGSGFMFPIWLSILIIFLLGLIIGWINGNLITRLKMNNFIVTLSMLIILRGLMYVLTNGAATYSRNPIFNAIASGKIGQFNYPLIIMLSLFFVAFIVLKYTKFGRELYAIGANKNAAFASGVNTEKRIRQAYIISSILAVLAGLLLASRLTAAEPTTGKGIIFVVFASAVIGGVSLQGGVGSIIGAFGGVLLLSTINSGLNLLDVSVFWVELIRGLLILIAMIIDAQKNRIILSSDTVTKPLKKAESILPKT